MVHAVTGTAGGMLFDDWRHSGAEARGLWTRCMPHRHAERLIGSEGEDGYLRHLNIQGCGIPLSDGVLAVHQCQSFPLESLEVELDLLSATP